MPHRIIIRHEAEVDITDAAIWYHKQQLAWGMSSSPKSTPLSRAPLLIPRSTLDCAASPKFAAS